MRMENKVLPAPIHCRALRRFCVDQRMGRKLNKGPDFTITIASSRNSDEDQVAIYFGDANREDT
jgi:hypothetical protein